MPTRYAHVVLIWPIALPGTGELRAEIDAAADGVSLVREDDGALVISRGEHVLRIRVREEALARWPVRCVGARHHTELWVPAGELDAFHAATVGEIEEVVGSPTK